MLAKNAKGALFPVPTWRRPCVELSERTTSSKVRSETVDSILSAVAKKKVVTSDKGTKNFESGNTGTTSRPASTCSLQMRARCYKALIKSRFGQSGRMSEIGEAWYHSVCRLPSPSSSRLLCSVTK